MQTDKITMVVETKDGRPLRTYSHEGKIFIESRENTEYQIRVKNRINNRVMAVVAVDGINVISGTIASDKPAEVGYVLGPYEEHVIKGYRINEEDVATFKFVKSQDGYAQEKGNGFNSGIIALRAWAEKIKEDSFKKLEDKLQKLIEKDNYKEKYIPYPIYPWDTSPWYKSYPAITPIWYYDRNQINTICDSNSKNVLATNISEEKMFSSIDLSNAFGHASSWGTETKDAVREVSFEPGDLLAEISIFYAPREGLKILGIDVEKTKAIAFPEPFRREFCSPPKSWTGHRG